MEIEQALAYVGGASLGATAVGSVLSIVCSQLERAGAKVPIWLRVVCGVANELGANLPALASRVGGRK